MLEHSRGPPNRFLLSYASPSGLRDEKHLGAENERPLERLSRKSLVRPSLVAGKYSHRDDTVSLFCAKACSNSGRPCRPALRGGCPILVLLILTASFGKVYGRSSALVRAAELSPLTPV